jgi:hypothetical protein
VLKWSSSEYGKCGTCWRKVSIFYTVTAMGDTVRNDPMCGCGQAIILCGLGTVYINRRKEGNFWTLRQGWQIVHWEIEYTSSCNQTANGALCDNVYTFTKVFFTFEIFIWFHSTFVKVIPGNQVKKVLLSLRWFTQNSYMHMCMCD